MLVLSRKKGEKIIIGDNIVLTVVAIRGEKVWLGIEAPKDVGIYREEVAERRAQAAFVEARGRRLWADDPDKEGQK